jgi:hypothetical protein
MPDLKVQGNTGYLAPESENSSRDERNTTSLFRLRLLEQE